MTSLSLHPVTREQLSDLACFSEQHGKFRYCSCMRWRMRSIDFGRSTKESRVAALERLVRDGKPTGVLAYLDGEPVGWCSVAPRESYQGLERYRELPRIDDQPVWAVVCFFVDRRFRRRGLTLALLRSEEHTSELQSPDHLVCRLLLEKKKNRAAVIMRSKCMPHLHTH